MPVRRLASSAFARQIRRAAWRRSVKLAAKRSTFAIARRAGMYSPYAGAALAGGAIVGYGAYKGIRKIRAARARARKRSTIAYPIRRIQCKHRVTADLDTTGGATRTLYQHRITDISKGGTADQREFDVINVKGFRINANFINNVITAPVRISFAVVANKTEANVNPSTPEFLRGYGDDRSVDFGTALNFIELMQTPINTDKYTVLHRWNFTLNPLTEGADTIGRPNNNRSSMKTISKYIKFKRQLRYDNTTDVPESGDIYLVWWGDFEYSSAGTLTQSNAYERQIRVIAFFNDAYR